MSATNQRKSTAAERVRLALADDIVRGLIGPGVTLDEASLAERFEVSRTPIREAIRQLEAIGFVKARPHRGAVVPHFTPEKLNEMFGVMAEMEALCARYAASAITEAEKAGLLAAHRACANAAEIGDIDVYYATNLQFHELIYTASHNGFLAEITLGVRNRVAPFRRAQFRSFGRLLRSAAEHGLIVERICAGDGDGAAAAMREHMRVVRNALGEALPALRADAATRLGDEDRGRASPG